MEFFEKVKDTKEIYNGKIFDVKKETVELPDGKTTTRELVLHNGGVGVIAMREDGKIPMVRQYRKGIDMISLEIPAGKLEKGEKPEDCGRRELTEETGYCAEDFALLSRFSVSPAYCSELIYVYKAEKLNFVGQHLDENEHLNVEYYTLDELCGKVKNGEIIDSKTIIAIMLMKNSL